MWDMRAEAETSGRMFAIIAGYEYDHSMSKHSTADEIQGSANIRPDDGRPTLNTNSDGYVA